MKGLLDQAGGREVGMPPGNGMPPQGQPQASADQGPAGDAAAAGVTPEMQAQAQELSKQAISILYADEQSFEKMVNVFKSAKDDRAIAQAMSVVANGTINKLEQETGPLPEPMVMSVGIVLIITLFQDLAQGQIIQDVSEQQFTMAAGKALQDWMQANPDRADVEGVQQMAQQAQQGGQPAPQAGVA